MEQVGILNVAYKIGNMITEATFRRISLEESKQKGNCSVDGVKKYKVVTVR